MYTHAEEIGAWSTIKRTSPATIELDDAFLALGVLGLDKGNKVRIDVEVGRYGRLSRLRSSSVRLFEEGSFIERLGAGQSWGQ